jgi:hypothetical protein
LQEERLREKEEDCDRENMCVEPAKIIHIYLHMGRDKKGL